MVPLSKESAMQEHTHAIIIIKNNNQEYLQYFDERWDCFLFPNCKLECENHSDMIKQYLNQKLNIECDPKHIIYKMDKVHEKYSVSANKMKTYHHYFYVAKSNEFINNSTDKTFTVNVLKCSWLSLTELENNKRIQTVNKDIVDFVKEIEAFA